MKRKKNQAKKVRVVLKQAANPKQRMGKSAGKVRSRSAFQKALQDPFDPSVYGVRVPDPFPFPTVTYTTHCTTVLGSASGISYGAAVFLPHPVISCLDITGLDNLSSSSINAVSSTGMSQIGSGIATTGKRIYGSTNNAAMRSILSSYRGVSWGIKISNLQPQLSATGRLIIAQLPIGDTVPTLFELANGLSPDAVTPILGYAPNTLDASTVLNLPTAIEIPVSQLINNTVLVCGMYTSARYWDFKTLLKDQASTGGFLDGDAVSYLGGAINDVGWKDNTRMNGGCAIVVYFEGVPLSTANVIQVETIYHIEGQTVSTTVPGALTANGAVAEMGSTQDMEEGMRSVSTMSRVVRFLQTGADFVRQNPNLVRGAMGYFGGPRHRAIANY